MKTKALLIIFTGLITTNGLKAERWFPTFSEFTNYFKEIFGLDEKTRYNNVEIKGYKDISRSKTEELHKISKRRQAQDSANDTEYNIHSKEEFYSYDLQKKGYSKEKADKIARNGKNYTEKYKKAEKELNCLQDPNNREKFTQIFFRKNAFAQLYLKQDKFDADIVKEVINMRKVHIFGNGE
jgi:hypothetical protein